MSKLDSWIDNKILQNLFIWFFLFLILLTTIQSDTKILSAIFAIFLLAPAVYINNLLILPFLKNKKSLFFVFFILNILIFTAISVFAIHIASSQPFTLRMYINFLGIMVLSLVFASTIKIARDSFARRQEVKEAELKLLKAQLNPHFLFNTLNNLYGLSVTKSDKLPDLMLKLSDLLRYSLYETKEALVPLKKEIQYLENYISLEKIRLEDTTHIEYTKSNNLSSKKIVPMLFIVFVENAFKHLNAIHDKKSIVSISIIEKAGTIFFECINTTNTLTNSIDIDLEKGKSGIGLQNVKKRLAILYPNTHKLNISRKKDTFSIELTIDL